MGREDATMHDYMHSEVNGMPERNGTNGHANEMDEFEDDVADEDLLMAEAMVVE